MNVRTPMCRKANYIYLKNYLYYNLGPGFLPGSGKVSKSATI